MNIFGLIKNYDHVGFTAPGGGRPFSSLPLAISQPPVSSPQAARKPLIIKRREIPSPSLSPPIPAPAPSARSGGRINEEIEKILEERKSRKEIKTSNPFASSNPESRCHFSAMLRRYFDLSFLFLVSNLDSIGFLGV